MSGILPVLTPIIGRIIGNLFPDEESRLKAESEVFESLLSHKEEIEKAAGEIITTEAGSQHWLAANWRPITMLVFCGLVVLHWLGFIAPNISEAQYERLWSVIETGIGGYMVGSSIERIAPALLKIVRKG